FKIVKTKTNIWKLLQELIELQKLKAAEKNLSISLIIDPRLPREIITDPLRMNQILTNLVSNAIKFTDKGEVIVKVSVINIYPQYVEIEFSVKDTGIGISKDKLHLIFNSFEQADDLTERKYGGTGLGLTIVKKLAELKGGTLKVESKEGEGSMFSFVNQYHYTNPT